MQEKQNTIAKARSKGWSEWTIENMGDTSNIGIDYAATADTTVPNIQVLEPVKPKKIKSSKGKFPSNFTPKKKKRKK